MDTVWQQVARVNGRWGPGLYYAAACGLYTYATEHASRTSLACDCQTVFAQTSSVFFLLLCLVSTLAGLLGESAMSVPCPAPAVLLILRSLALWEHVHAVRNPGQDWSLGGGNGALSWDAVALVRSLLPELAPSLGANLLTVCYLLWVPVSLVASLLPVALALGYHPTSTWCGMQLHQQRGWWHLLAFK
jgi:hypothetical protein